MDCPWYGNRFHVLHPTAPPPPRPVRCLPRPPLLPPPPLPPVVDIVTESQCTMNELERAGVDVIFRRPAVPDQTSTLAASNHRDGRLVSSLAHAALHLPFSFLLRPSPSACLSASPSVGTVVPVQIVGILCPPPVEPRRGPDTLVQRSCPYRRRTTAIQRASRRWTATAPPA